MDTAEERATSPGPEDAPIDPVDAKAGEPLLAETASRKDSEGALRESLDKLRAAELLRRSSEEELRDFFENATVALHWVGPDGTILWANRAELDLLGYSADEYI